MSAERSGGKTLRERLRDMFTAGPCDRCGVRGGSRWTRGEIVDGEIVKRALCNECSKTVFLRPWVDDRKWVSW